MPNPLPTRGALDLGPTLTNVRAPIANELSAVHVEKIKDWLIALATELGNPDGSTVGSLWEAAGGGGGFSFFNVRGDDASPTALPSANAVITCDNGDGDAEVVLPAASASEGVFLVFRKTGGTDGAFITLAPDGTDEIEGANATYQLPYSNADYVSGEAPPMSWTMFCDGAAWWLGTSFGLDGARRTGFLYQTASPALPTTGGGMPVLVSTASNAVAFGLPDPSGRNKGRRWPIIKTNTGTNGVSLTRYGSETINGVAASFDLPGSTSAEVGFWELVSDGTNWWVSPAAGGGLLFDLRTTVTTDIETTTEVRGKTGPGGSAFAGTVTPTGNVASAWDSATKVLTLTTSAGMEGLGLRRVLCGTLPAEGFVVDLGIADLGGLLTTRLVLALYEQRAGVNGRGIALAFLDNDATLYMTGFGDDGVDAPAVNTSPLAFDASTGGFANAPYEFDRGPVRVIAEFRKVDGSSPERWTVRVRLEGHSGSIQSHRYSGIYAPSSAWSTALDVSGVTMSRIALGAWCTSAEGGDLAVSHLRVYELGSALPA